MKFLTSPAQAYRKYWYRGGLGTSLVRTRNMLQRQAVTQARPRLIAKFANKSRPKAKGPMQKGWKWVEAGKNKAAAVITNAVRNFARKSTSYMARHRINLRRKTLASRTARALGMDNAANILEYLR